MDKTISIALATYNGELFLREQLESLYNQTYIPDEVIVVDDCSNDKTQDILEEYHQKFGLKYIINDQHLGVNKNFEKAILLCTGDYIALCDQDDIWMPHKIETSYKKLQSIEQNKPALVSSKYIEVDAELNTISNNQNQEKDTEIYYSTLFEHHSQGCSLMMNRILLDYVLPLPSDGKIMYDIYIGVIAAMVGNKYNMAETLMYYRRHSFNVCGRIIEKPGYFQRIKNRFQDQYPNFLSDVKLYCLKEISKMKSEYFLPERKPLYNKILSLGINQNITKKIAILLSIKELSYKNRFLIILNTLASFILRKAHHYFKRFIVLRH